MNKKPYISLHLHTNKSIGDAILTIDGYMKKAKELNLSAASITNHGSMIDIYEFFSACKKNNIKPIIGCEFYIYNDYLPHDEDEKANDKRNREKHIVLIAKDYKGFQNLLLLHNLAQIDNFYYKPMLTIDNLKTYSEGLICLTACVGGYLPSLIMHVANKENATENDNQMIIDMLEELKQIFKDDLYLELQPGTFRDQIIVNNTLIELSKICNVKTVITNDVHYLNEDDWFAHNIHVCSSRKKIVSDTIEYPDKCYYVMSNEDLYKWCNGYIPEQVIDTSIDNIYEIIDKVEEYNIIPDKTYMPSVDVPCGFSNDSYIEYLCFSRLQKIRGTIKDVAEYSERILKELKVIEKLGFSGYFLTVRDYMLWAKNNDIMTGPGRGSVAGSLVAYLLDITRVDPIKYGLLFERFLSEFRPSPPDIDEDFDNEERPQMFKYVVNKYGMEHCCLVSTMQERHSKNALRDSARVLQIDPEIVDTVVKLIPDVIYEDDADGNSEKITDLSIEDSIEAVPKLKEYYNEYPDWFNTAIKISNLPRAASVHAAGTIISPQDLTKMLPLIKSSNDYINATSLDLHAAETAGVIKFDFLSLGMLHTLKIAKTFAGITDDIYDIMEEYDDDNVWNMIGTKYTEGIFQISSNIYQQRMARLKPHTIKELAACLALVRGPCIASKDDEKYMKVLEGKAEIEKIHPIYDKITERTNGILIYQEQLMMICFNMGFTLDEGYTIMKAAAKKKIAVLKDYKKQFMSLAKEKDMDYDTAEIIFKKIVDSGLYSFNESHAICYAMISYMTAWFKTYYPTEYMAAFLTSIFENKTNKVSKKKSVINECRRLGIKFLPLDINKSQYSFSPEGDHCIRIGFCAVKSFGDIAYNELNSKRPFTSLNDVYEKVEKKLVNKGKIIAAILAGAFDEFNQDRYSLYFDYCKMSQNDVQDELNLKWLKKPLQIINSPEEYEKAFFEVQLLTDPVNSLEHTDISKNEFSIIGICSKIKKVKDKNQNQMAFLSLDTAEGSMDVVVFANVFDKYKKIIKKNMIYSFNLKRNKNNYIFKSCESKTM